jgi:hypothetical protein
MTSEVPTGYPVLSGETLVVPIVGDPIAQVKSPDGVTRALVARGRNAIVVPMHVLPDDLDAVVRGLGPVRSIAGLIATVPHKFGLAAHCATLTDRAAFLGSVNVARRNADGIWHGDQIDGAAFVAACRANGARLDGARALQVGAGGAGRRSRWPCSTPGSPSWPCTTPTAPDSTPWPVGCASGTATVSAPPLPTRPATGSSPTPPRWACARVTRCPSTSTA